VTLMKKTIQWMPFVFILALGMVPAAIAVDEVDPVAAYAQNNYANRAPINAVNGAGLTGDAHDNSPNDTMWMGSSSSSFAKWFITDLGSFVPLHSIKIWNYNQANYTGRGVKTIDIYTSMSAGSSMPTSDFSDTSTWTLLKAGHIVAKASGATDYTGDAVLYLPITVEARWVGFDIKSLHEGNGYGGISEIKFYSSSSPVVRLDGISSVNTTSVGVDGTLVKDNDIDAHVLACLGEAEAGGSLDDWDIVADFGVKSVGAFQETVTGLTAGRGYVLALCATNGIDEPGWSPVRETFITDVISVEAPGDVYESSATPVSILFTRPESTTNVALTVNYTLGGTAVAGEDYEVLDGSFTFPAEEMTFAVSFKPVDNELEDGNRTVTVSVSTGNYLTDATSTASFTILDDESLARDVTWTGNGGDLSWNTAANWSSSEVPLPVDTVNFTDSGLAGGDVISLDANQAVRKIVISTPISFTIGHADDVTAGYSLALTDFDRQDVEGTEGRHTFAAPVNLVPDSEGNSTWTINGSDLVRMNAVLGSVATTTFVKMGTGTFNMNYRSPTYTGPWNIVEGAVTASSSTSINFNESGTMRGTITIGGTDVPASLSQTTKNALFGNSSITVLTNGSFTCGDLDDSRVSSVHVKEGGTATINGSYFYCYTAYLTGGTITGPQSAAFYNGGYNQRIQSYSSDNTAYYNIGFTYSEYFDAYVVVADGPPAIDLDMTLGRLSGKAKVLRKQGAGTVIFGQPSTHYNTDGTNSVGFAIEGGRAIFNNETGSGSGKNRLQVNGGATIGGTGFLGGDSAHANFSVLIQGSSGSNRATVEPGSVDSATGESLIGTLTVGSVDSPNTVTFGNYSRLNLQIGTEGAADRLEVYGSVDLSSASDALTLTVNDDARAGVYTLVSASEGITGAFNTIDVPNPLLLTQTATTIEYIVPAAATLFMIR
jgi:hypothetical protein